MMRAAQINLVAVSRVQAYPAKGKLKLGEWVTGIESSGSSITQPQTYWVAYWNTPIVKLIFFLLIQILYADSLLYFFNSIANYFVFYFYLTLHK
jgi:hypothetical protein